MSTVVPPGPPLRFSAPRLSPSVRAFVANEAGSAVVLLAATLVALAWANSPWWHSYDSLWETPVSLRVGSEAMTLDLRHVVNDAAMALFFLVLGLEITSEVTTGDLRDPRKVVVPALGAVGGMLVPVAIYLAVDHSSQTAHGWGVVMSTDTAFVLGVLALFGPRCPDALRLFLLTLAVVDDIGAITVLAVAYTESVRVWPLVVAAALLAAFAALRWLGAWRTTPYVLLGVALWCAVYRSGVHPTLAGVLVGLLVPATPVHEDQTRRLLFFGRALAEEPTAAQARVATLAVQATVPTGERLQRELHPWSAYVVVPLFGLANAGVHVDGGVLHDASTSPLTLGIVVALVVGNAVGITLASWAALRSGLGDLPGRVRYGHLVGGAVLAGMGFTISLFVADLAFDDPVLRDQAKIGVLAGSLVAAVLGTLVIRFMGERSPLCTPASGLPAGSLPPLPWTSPAGG
ncbi:Na+/H+ antiporter NhaA [Motilibacter peucedani]|uniref:Na(+)/H(+) antiporter NhaA n=1 Tax=Motilibacter peucedani TaxID=598650 RepID=A0A420XQ97_9ACTN|nr:Na+/H+ antiporter NhaA [Motilibacter peucedani]RKS75424.1 Na+/H+ antiporter NhaA [Motilibacter peucedani]